MLPLLALAQPLPLILAVRSFTPPERPTPEPAVSTFYNWQMQFINIDIYWSIQYLFLVLFHNSRLFMYNISTPCHSSHSPPSPPECNHFQFCRFCIYFPPFASMLFPLFSLAAPGQDLIDYKSISIPAPSPQPHGPIRAHSAALHPGWLAKAKAKAKESMNVEARRIVRNTVGWRSKSIITFNQFVFCFRALLCSFASSSLRLFIFLYIYLIKMLIFSFFF